MLSQGLGLLGLPRQPRAGTPQAVAIVGDEGGRSGLWCLCCEGPAGTADLTSFLLGDCAAGHWCKGGATSQDPTNGARGLLCPAGHFCLEGTSPALGPRLT